MATSDFKQRSDQFDIRLNIYEPNPQAWLDKFIVKVDKYVATGSVRYIHVSAPEVGDVPGRSSYGKMHVHIALVLYNYTTKHSIVRRFTQEGYGWYVEPRDKSKPIQGWIDYHSKSRTKVDQNKPPLEYKYGTLPKDRAKRKSPEEMTPLEEARSKKKQEDWSRKKYLMQLLDWDQLDEEFPGFIYSSMGQTMKREVLKQSNDKYTKPLLGKLKNFIIWGPSGSGKSSSVALLYPNCYKKQKGTQYWDSYDKTNVDHSIVWIDEMSKETLATMTGKADGGFEFLKELADRYPVTVDEKYTKGYKIRPKTLIITMNEHPNSLLPARAIEVNKQALYRKFKILYVSVSST